MSIGKHYNTKKSIPESLCTDLLKNVDLFIGLVGLHQVSVFGWCYFILPCFFCHVFVLYPLVLLM